MGLPLPNLHPPNLRVPWSPPPAVGTNLSDGDIGDTGDIDNRSIFLESLQELTYVCCHRRSRGSRPHPTAHRGIRVHGVGRYVKADVLSPPPPWRAPSFSIMTQRLRGTTGALSDYFKRCLWYTEVDLPHLWAHLWACRVLLRRRHADTRR